MAVFVFSRFAPEPRLLFSEIQTPSVLFSRLQPIDTGSDFSRWDGSKLEASKILVWGFFYSCFLK